MDKETYKSKLIDLGYKDIYCKNCGDVIYWSNSSKVNKANNLEGRSFKMNCILYDKEYKLSYCEECCFIKHPEYRTKNKTRFFNRLSYFKMYAFDIPIKIGQQYLTEVCVQSEENMIKRYGEEEGKKNWQIYLKKQADSNKFEYKKEKYGWTEEQYNEYNQNRAVTIENLVKKHGEIEGIKVWNDYIESQRYTKSKEYVVNRYGEEYWIELCKSKKHDIEGFIKRNGEAEAEEKYTKHWSNISNPALVSRHSQKYFKDLDSELMRFYRTQYFDKNGKEYGKNLQTRWIWIDYFIYDLNVAVEFNGDLYHANPNKFKAYDKPIPFSDMTSEEIWKKDEERIRLLKEKYDVDTVVVWEGNLPDVKQLANLIIEKYGNKKCK